MHMLDTLRRSTTTGTQKGRRAVFSGYSYGDIKKGRAASYPWLVIADPSGDFLGRCFRSLDLNTRYNSHWPIGIVFENERTGERKRWTGKRFVKVKR